MHSNNQMGGGGSGPLKSQIIGLLHAIAYLQGDSSPHAQDPLTVLHKQALRKQGSRAKSLLLLADAHRWWPCSPLDSLQFGCHLCQDDLLALHGFTLVFLPTEYLLLLLY